MAKQNGKNEKVGALGGLFGFPVTAVLRRLGREGISTAHARAIIGGWSALWRVPASC